MSRKPYMPFYVDDYLSGTRHLKPEEKGIYVDCLMIQWSRQMGLPTDDEELARLLGIDIRVCRRVITVLFDDEKLVIVDGKFYNLRLAREAELLPKIVETFGKLSENFRKTYRKSSKKVSRKSEGKPNENNGPSRALENHIQNHNQNQEQEYTSQQDLDSVAEDPDPDLRAGLNGATDLVIADLARWINPTFPDIVTAQGALRTQIGIHGAPIVKQAYGELKAQMDSGDLISRPIVVLDKICQRIKREGPKAPHNRQTQHDKVQAALKTHSERHANV